MRDLLKRILKRPLNAAYNKYGLRVRKYRWKGIRAEVFPTVFHPGLFISTTLLLDYLSKQDLQAVSFLELGAGSGVISVLAAKKNAKVTASDINPQAVKNVQRNALLNKVEIETIESDLFEQLAKRSFDIIVINPPYYAKNATNPQEQAFYCGEDFEYFKRLFADLNHYLHKAGKCIMILSEDCELDTIKQLAEAARIEIQLILEKKKMGERNYLFNLKPIPLLAAASS